MVKISIVIVNYKTLDLLLDCIKSIIAETRVSYEIIVIDNNSNDDLKKIEDIFPAVRIIEMTKNNGFGIANNIGIENSNGQYILLLNSDTKILEGAIDKTFDFMTSEFALVNNVGLTGCKLISKDNLIQHSVFREWGTSFQYFLSSNPILSKLIKSKHHSFNYHSFSPKLVSGGVSGAFMFFRKEVFDNIQPFDPDIFMYSEETELCRNRIIEHYNIAYFPQAKILHYGGSSAPKDVMHYQNMLSTALVWYKKGRTIYIYFIFISVINFITSIIIYPFASKLSKSWLKKNIKGFVKILDYLVFEIPKYKRNWGARKSPLKLKELDK